MRFAGNTSNVGSWIQAGRAGSRGGSDFFKVARANAPDYGGLAETAMKARSSERVAATQAEAEVAQAGIRAKAKMVKTKNDVEAGKEINDMKVGAKRMAGVVGALGAVAGGAFMGIENKRADKRQAERDALDEQRWQQRLEVMKRGVDRDSEPTEKPEPFTPEPFDPDRNYSTNPLGGLPSVTSDSPTPADPDNQQTGGGVQPTTTEPVTSQPLLRRVATPQVLSKAQLKQLGRNAGFPESELNTFAAVAMGESGGKTDAYNGKGNDDSYGIMQINMLDRPGYQMGAERRQQFGLKSNDELLDPQVNANAAFKIWQSQGWKGWGAYTNGSYQQHL